MTKVTLETSDPMVLRAVADALEGKYGVSGDADKIWYPQTETDVPTRGIAIPDAPSSDDIMKIVAASQEPTPVVPAVSAGPEAPEAPTAPTASDDSDVDCHGMPYNAEIHAETRNKNADGSWKARRGKAEEAKKALAEWKASGGNVTPPSDLPEPPAATQEAQTDEPELPMSMPEVPTMPQPEQVAEPETQPELPAVVSQADLETKIIGMMKRGTLSNDKYVEVLKNNNVDLTDPTGILTNDAVKRAAVYADMCEIEPEC